MNSFVQRASTLTAALTPHEKMLKIIKSMVPDLGKEIYGDSIHWQVNEYQGVITARWDLTFRRDTKTRTFQEHSAKIGVANKILESIKKKFPKRTIDIRLCTLDGCKRSDKIRDENGDGDGGYSEYEQSIGGQVKVKVLKEDDLSPTANVMFVYDREARAYLIDKFHPEVLGKFQHLRFKSKSDYDAAEKYLVKEGHAKGAHFGQSDGHWDSDAY